ncbi:MAG: hypothetical protein JRN15_15305 [Nitrososphaerota archaeon]|nr:hypothetical protein [Nitrososphaerota archaeon]
MQSDSDKKSISLNSSNFSGIIGNIKSKGPITINIFAETSMSSQDDQVIDDIIEKAGKIVDAHESSIVFDEDISAYFTAPSFTSGQMRYLKHAAKLEWNKEKINALRLSFKIINLEDAKLCKEASSIFQSMLRSRKSSLLRRMYNFARSGHIDEFMAKSLFSPLQYNDSAMDKLLDYFPSAIWINIFTDLEIIESELLRRTTERVRNVRLYARGAPNIIALKDYVEAYTMKHIQSDATIYLESSNDDYTIGCTRGATITLELVQINEDLERIMAHKEREKKLRRK